MQKKCSFLESLINRGTGHLYSDSVLSHSWLPVNPLSPNRKDKKQCAALHVAVTDVKLKGVFNYCFVTHWRSTVDPRYAKQSKQKLL